MFTLSVGIFLVCNDVIKNLIYGKLKQVLLEVKSTIFNIILKFNDDIPGE